MKKFITIIGLAAAVSLAGGHAQVQITAFNTPYTQNFNAIDADNTIGDATVLPTNWAITGEQDTYRGTSTTSATGGIYGYNSETAGYLPSSSADNVQFTLSLQNKTGSTISELSVSYVGEQWRGVSGRENTWVVELDTGSGFNAVSGLTFTPNTDGTLASAASLSNSSIAVSIANDATFAVRWVSDRGTGTGSSQGISFDDVSVSAIPEPGTWALIGLGSAVVLWRMRRRNTTA